jgi:1,2-diacylglycerol 3-alpha-glucosyltransferase
MLTDSYLPSRDGVVTSILLTKQKLEDMGHDVFIVAPEPTDKADKQEGVHYFPSVEFRKYPGYWIPILPSNKIEIVKGLEVDVIHSQGLLFMGLKSMLTGHELRKPVVVTYHTMVTEAMGYYSDLPIPQEWAERLFWVYLRKLLEHADAVIAPTQAIADELTVRAPNMKKVEVIPTGVDCIRFHPSVDGSGLRERYGLNGRKAIVHVGRIAKEKNIELPLEGLALMDTEAVLIMVGKGPAMDHYREYAKGLGIAERVIFTGFVPDEELPQHYAMADALVLASKFETQGLVLLEAMACGTPVSGINFRAVAEIIDDGRNGFLFEDEPRSCAKAMERAVDCPEEVRIEARRKAERFSLAEGARKLVDVYESVVNAKRASQRE